MSAGEEALIGRGLLSHPSDGVSLVVAVREHDTVVDFVTEVANGPAVRFAGVDVQGRRVRELFPGPAAAGIVAWLAAVLESGGAATQRRSSEISHAPEINGCFVELFATSVGDDRVVLQMRDVTEETRLRETLEHEALHDALTGLPNRRWFAQELQRALHRLRRATGAVAVLFCDLDDFKVINDTLGHAAGDELLRQTADRLARELRPSDSVARFGADEIVVLCEDIADPAAAGELAERLQGATSGSYRVAGADVHVTVSVGVAIADGDAGAESLVAEADAALYEAKRLGRNRVALYDSRLGQLAARRLRVHHELTEALARGEFELHYQPQYDLRSGSLVGAEALLRWVHPVTGVVLPEQFLSVAQDTGLVTQIGAWVIREATEEARRWGELTPAPPQLQVNLCTQELMHPQLPGLLQEALTTAGLHPSRLELEITETQAPEDLERLTGSLRHIHDMGVQIALDDFGTGYSSLLWLQRFPVSTVKLDRSFTARIVEAAPESTIVRSTIALAHALDMRVVAEGIETPLQRQILTDLGADLGQGFHLAPPMPPEELRALLALDGAATAPAGRTGDRLARRPH